MIELVFPSYIQLSRGAINNNEPIDITVVFNAFFPNQSYYVRRRYVTRVYGRLNGLQTETTNTWVNEGKHYNSYYFNSGGYLSSGGAAYGDCGQGEVIFEVEFYSDSNYTNKIKTLSISNSWGIRGDVYEYNTGSWKTLWDIWDYTFKKGIEEISISDNLLWDYGKLWNCDNGKLKIYHFLTSQGTNALPVGGIPSFEYPAPSGWDTDEKNWKNWSNNTYHFLYSDGETLIKNRYCRMSWTEYNEYKTYPAQHLQKTMTAEVKMNKEKYVLFRDLIASVSVKDTSRQNIQYVDTNYGYKSDGDNSIQTFYLPIGQLPVGEHPLYVGIWGEYYNSNLIDTINTLELPYNSENKYEIGTTLIEIYNLYVIHSDGTTTQRYDWKLTYENGKCYLWLNENIASDDTLHIEYKEYENVGVINIVYSDTPINFYIEDKESIEKYGKRATKEIYLPVQDISTAKLWGKKFLKTYAYPKIQRKYDIIDLNHEIIPNIGDYVDEYKIKEVEISIDKDGVIEGTIITGDVDRTILEIMANRF